jgi:hypothetical protein
MFPIPVHVEHFADSCAWPAHGPHEAWGFAAYPINETHDGIAYFGRAFWLYTPWGGLRFVTLIGVNVSRMIVAIDHHP